MDALKIHNEIEGLVKELKRIAKENKVSIRIYASPYVHSKDSAFITHSEIKGDKDIEETLYQEENEELNIVFTYQKLTFKKEKTA